MNNQEIGHCKDCDRWEKGKRENNEDWYSDEGFCNNWRTITGEDFYCADFEVKENKTMKYKAIVEYEYPIEHKPPVKADIYLHGDKVSTKKIKPIKTGYWKRISPAGIYVCSECGQNLMTAKIECYKFCHGCSAEMGEQK